jgi:hypothetical protein
MPVAPLVVVRATFSMRARLVGGADASKRKVPSLMSITFGRVNGASRFSSTRACAVRRWSARAHARAARAQTHLAARRRREGRDGRDEAGVRSREAEDAVEARGVRRERGETAVHVQQASEDADRDSMLIVVDEEHDGLQDLRRNAHNRGHRGGTRMGLNVDHRRGEGPSRATWTYGFAQVQYRYTSEYPEI